MTRPRQRFLKAFTLTVFVHSFAGWVYIAMNAVVHPESLSWPLTHFVNWPREDSFGAACFVISFVSLFSYLFIKNNQSDTQYV